MLPTDDCIQNVTEAECGRTVASPQGVSRRAATRCRHVLATATRDASVHHIALCGTMTSVSLSTNVEVRRLSGADPAIGGPGSRLPHRACLCTLRDSVNLYTVFILIIWGRFRKKIEIILIHITGGSRGTDSWLDGTDTHKHFRPDLSLLFKMHKIWSIDYQENY